MFSAPLHIVKSILAQRNTVVNMKKKNYSIFLDKRGELSGMLSPFCVIAHQSEDWCGNLFSLSLYERHAP